MNDSSKDAPAGDERIQRKDIVVFTLTGISVLLSLITLLHGHYYAGVQELARVKSLALEVSVLNQELKSETEWAKYYAAFLPSGGRKPYVVQVLRTQQELAARMDADLANQIPPEKLDRLTRKDVIKTAQYLEVARRTVAAACGETRALRAEVQERLGQRVPEPGGAGQGEGSVKAGQDSKK